MFKGILATPAVQGRAARRLATVVDGARRSRQPHMKETLRQSTRRLRQLQQRQPQRTREGSSLLQLGKGQQKRDTIAMEESWTTAQTEALAQEDACHRQQNPQQPFRNTGVSASASPSSTTHYDAVNTETGHSLVQERFDILVHRALLQYGPPLPVEVVMHHHITHDATSISPNQPQHGHRPDAAASTSQDCGADNRNTVYFDTVGLKMHELMSVLRKVHPHFSVREDCDGVPLSLMVKNCSYLNAYGGKVNYLRFLRRLRRSDGADKDGGDTLVLSLGKYKMREMMSQDGLRQGPQPWRYSYTTL